MNALASMPATLVFFEGPSRISEALADLALELGPRPAAVARELTKVYEEVRRGDLDALAAYYAEADPPRGEIVIVVGPAPAGPTRLAESFDAEIQAALATLSVKDAAAAVAARSGLPRREIYSRALQLARQRR